MSNGEKLSQKKSEILQGTLDLMIRLQQQGWIKASWGASENIRKAKSYTFTRSGRGQLAEQTDNWERIAGVIGRGLQAARGKG
jgi:DNA-binding PadR family transcriptional regulator